MTNKRSHYYSLVPIGIFVLAVGLLSGFNVLVSALPSPGFIIGVVDDWSNRHVAFANPGTGAEALAGGRFEEWYRKVNGSRYVMQQMRRNAMSRPVMSAPDFASRMAILNEPTERENELSKWKRVPLPEVKTDWNVSVGPIGVGSGNFPAKFSLNGAASASDIAVFNTSSAGGTSVATVIGINNLYVTSPTVAFAYNTTTGDTVATSTVFDLAGDQIAFISTSGGHAYLNVLRFKTGTGNGTAYASPVRPATVSTTGSAYTTCKAGARSCLFRKEFANAATDTNSSPYYEYDTDVLWVGDNSGHIHEFTGVFKGTAAESGNPWATTGASTILTSTVSDGSYVYVAGSNGIVYSVQVSTPTNVHASAAIAQGTLGINDGPMLDTTNSKLYVAMAYDVANGASGVFQLPTPNLGSYSGVDFAAVSTAARTVPTYVGTFDNTYYTSGAGYITTCNISGANGLLYLNPQQLSHFTAVDGAVSYQSNYEEVATGADVCSPQTEVLSGTTDYVFVSVAQNPATIGTATGRCTSTSGCVYSYALGTASAFTFTGTSHTPIAQFNSPRVTSGTAGSTSGIIVDSTAAGSHIYYTTNGTGTTPGSPSCTTTSANCATQLTQSALN